MTLQLGLLAAAFLSWWWSGLLRRYALDQGLLDRPNARSSHHAPTPRGGGLAFVLVVLLGVMLLLATGGIQHPLGWAVLGGGGLVALAGWLDDHGHLAARWRLLVHTLAALWGLAWIGGVPPVMLGTFLLEPTLPLQSVALLALVWMINLFNFMDGLDAIASVEAISVSVMGSLITTAAIGPSVDSAVPLVVAAAVAGFLVWNWPPARLFMGDAGSGFLGFALGLFSLAAGHQAPALLWSWLILSGVFLVDATWTLFRRLCRLERIWQAHRSHAYQRAARLIGSHRPVSLAVLVINLGWLAPIAALVAFNRLDGPLGFLIGLGPLWVLAIGLQAGEASPERDGP